MKKNYESRIKNYGLKLCNIKLGKLNFQSSLTKYIIQ